MNTYLSSAALFGGVVVLALIALAIIKDLLSNTNKGWVARFLVEVGPGGSGGSKPSISRLQMLIWNFVIAFAFLYVIATNGGDGLKTALDNLLTQNVLILLGISNGTYVLGKISKQGSVDEGGAGAAVVVEKTTASSAVPAPRAEVAPAPLAKEPGQS